MMEPNEGLLVRAAPSSPAFITTSIQLAHVPLGLARVCLCADSSDVAAGQTLSAGVI